LSVVQLTPSQLVVAVQRKTSAPIPFSQLSLLLVVETVLVDLQMLAAPVVLAVAALLVMLTETVTQTAEVATHRLSAHRKVTAVDRRSIPRI